ncbi:MAG: ATP-binding protein [Desulfomicrobium escambiense]|nr:ATP-binding protein [Desulfomicrobium escambiense]
MTDGDKLRQVLVNVLQNAVDAVDVEGRITVEVREEKRSTSTSQSGTTATAWTV